jgi:hypothetical protein
MTPRELAVALGALPEPWRRTRSTARHNAADALEPTVANVEAAR